MKKLLLAGVSVPMLVFSTASWAQDGSRPTTEQSGTAGSAASSLEDERNDELVVTGSRIRGVAPVGSNVVAVGREDMVTSGATTTADVLRQIPQITSLGFNQEGAQGPAAASNVTRATAPNLRGIGPTATLTVLDGRRLAAGGTQGQLLDPSSIPPLAVERIEVIADGASAIYGSDAVAGVINIIPRKHYDGAEVSFRVGTAANYWDYQVGGVVGTASDLGSIMVAVDHTWNSALDAQDRDFVTSDRSGFGGADGRNVMCGVPGTLTVTTTGPGANYLVPEGNGRDLTLAGLTAGRNLCDPAKLQILLPENERTSVFSYGELNVSSDVKLFAQGFHSRRTSDSRAPLQFNNTLIPATNPFRPSDAAPGARVQYSGLLQEQPFTTSTSRASAYQLIAGAEVKLSDMRLRVSGSTARGEDKLTENGGLNNFELNQLLADSNPATSLNLFGVAGSNNPATLSRLLSGLRVIQGVSTLKTIDATFDGPIFSLPGGDVRIAAGGEYREEGLTGDFLSSSPANGQPVTVLSGNKRNVKAVYGELFIPLFGTSNARPGFERLEISAALRWEEYSDFGTTTNPKIGMSWRPFDALTFRGSYGTSFRAPGLSENDPFSSGSGIYLLNGVTLADGTVINGVSLAGGNPYLQPETASTWSAGFDIAPVDMPGTRLSATYFNVDYKNQIVDGFARAFLYLNNPSQYPDYVAFQGDANFDRLRQLVVDSTFTTTPPINYSDPSLVLINARRANVGTVQVRGIDVQATAAINTASAGTFTLGANGTYFVTYKTGEANTPLTERVGDIAFPVRFQARGTAGWRLDGFSVQATLNHVAGYRNTNSLLVPRIRANDTVDFDMSYAFGEDTGNFERNMRLGLNVRNLFNRAPPQADLNNGYDATYASALGRTVALTLSKRW